MHIEVMKPPEGMKVDHRDGDGLNNQRSNLLVCTHAENMRNRKRPRNNSSGFIGVQKDSWATTGLGTLMWRATVQVDGKLIILGTFADPEEAAVVRDGVVAQLYGDYASLNFPDEPRAALDIKPASDYIHRLRHTELRDHKIYGVWLGMRRRCQLAKPNNEGDLVTWLNYGGRGIRVCKRWQSFDNFVDDMFASYVDGFTLERKNPNKGYRPDNCIWIPRREQNVNRRNTRWITIGGRKQSLSAWLREVSNGDGQEFVKMKARLYRQLRRGRSAEEVLNEFIGNQASAVA